MENLRGRGRPSCKAAKDIDALILAVARRRFAEDGFKRTSMESIHSEAQVARATLYLRYPDKKRLFQTVIFQAAMEVMPVEPCEFATLEDRVAFEIERYLTVAAHPEILRLLTGISNRGENAGNSDDLETILGTIGLAKLALSFDATAAATGMEISDSTLLAQLVFDTFVARRRREIVCGTVDLAERSQFAQAVATALIAGVGRPLRAVAKRFSE